LSCLGTRLLKCHFFSESSSELPLEGTSSSTTATEALQEHVIRYETRLAKRVKFTRTQGSLPNELLCQILKITIETTPAQSDPHRVQKYELATVCRRWRDIIFNTPLFWTLIRVAPTWRKALVKVHLERSRQCPLDLVFAGFRSETEFNTFLNIVMPTTHRWRSLAIFSQGTINTLFILQRFDCAAFPLLTLLSIPNLPPTVWRDRYWIPYYPKILYPENVPGLKSLEIRHDFSPPDDLRFPPTLERLSVHIAFYRIYTDKATRWLQSSSLQGLKALSLRGYIAHLQMQPNSIHLPRLVYFSCEVIEARDLLEGLVAPNLTHVNYIQSHFESLCEALGGIQSKWASVRELSFRFERIGYPRAYTLRDLCLAAPNLRGLEVMEQNLGSFLGPEDGLRPIDRWEHLERFVIISDVQKLGSMRRRLVPWLKERMKFGRPALEVFFAFTDPRQVKLDRGALDKVGKYCRGIGFCMEEEIGHTLWPDDM